MPKRNSGRTDPADDLARPREVLTDAFLHIAMRVFNAEERAVIATRLQASKPENGKHAKKKLQEVRDAAPADPLPRPGGREEIDEDTPLPRPVPHDPLGIALLYGVPLPKILLQLASSVGVWRDAIIATHELWAENAPFTQARASNVYQFESYRWNLDTELPQVMVDSVAFDPLRHINLSTKFSAGSVERLAQLQAAREVTLTFTGRRNFPQLPLHHFTDLQSLELAGCMRLRDADLGPLSTCTQLRSLEVASADSLTGEGLKHLAGLTGLRSLRLPGCSKVVDSDLAHLSRMAELAELNLLATGVHVTEICIGHLQVLGKLRKLCIPGCRRAPHVLAELQRLTTLTQLVELQGARIGAYFSELAPLDNLTALDAGFVEGTHSAGALPQLERLTVRSGNIPDLTHMRKLRYFDTYSNGHVTSDTLSQLSGCLEMEELHLLHCNIRTLAFLAPLRNLRTLHININVRKHKTNKDPLGPLAGLVNLTELDINRSFGVAGSMLAPLVNLKSLTDLSLDCCSDVDDAALVFVGKCTSLKYLNLCQTSVTDAGLASLSTLQDLRDLTMATIDVTYSSRGFEAMRGDDLAPFPFLSKLLVIGKNANRIKAMFPHV